MLDPAPIREPSPITAVGWTPGSGDGLRMQAGDGAGESRARLGRPNRSAAGEVRKIRRNDQAARCGGFRVLRRLAVSHEGQLRGARGLQRRGAVQFLFTVAFESGAEPLGEFPNPHHSSGPEASGSYSMIQGYAR